MRKEKLIMNDEIKNLLKKIERTICPECRRVDLPCHECPVHELGDICRADNAISIRTLISKQQFEYLCDIGVVKSNKCSSTFDLVIYPYNMEYCCLFNGNMAKDLLKDTPWQIKFNTETHVSPDTRVAWCIPEWLFMDNQVEILKTYFGRG